MKLVKIFQLLIFNRGCSFKAIGLAIAWIGVVYRTVAIVAVAVILSKLTESNPEIYTILLSILLTYCFLSLAADLLLIVGVEQENPYYLVPYLSMNGIEIFCLVVGLIGGSILFSEIDSTSTLGYFIPVGLLIIAIDVASWLCLLTLFKRLEKSLEEKSEETSTSVHHIPNPFNLRFFFRQSRSMQIDHSP